MREALSRLARVRVRGWLRACDQVGDDVVLEGMPTIGNQGRMSVGNRFHLASLPVGSHMVSGPEGALEIGDDVSIAYGAAIAAYKLVRIGSGTRVGPFVIIMDTNFHVIGDQSQRHDKMAPIAIGSGVRIGSRVTILRGSVIHDDASIEAGSVVTGVVPRGARAGGVPAVVLPSSGRAREDDPSSCVRDRLR
jgi:acetyltransferase-like isoleucine patch superfamily enzyme